MVHGRISSIEAHGHGLRALESRESVRFIGFTGLARVDFDATFAPATEISWRLARDAWGHGYASEAARVCLELAFNTLEVTEVVSMTAAITSVPVG